MNTLATISVCLVALLHGFFFLLEAVLWKTPRVRRLFGQSEEEAEVTRVMALNQGAYNLGAAVMLIVFLALENQQGVLGVLAFLAVMGCVGAATADRMILAVQTLPAVVAIALVTLS
jgi:putative membrane protein